VIPLPSRILVARDPVDLRKSIDGLASVCELVLREQPLDGTLFLFTNRRRDGLKALMWTYGGFTLLYKKLEQGRFRWPELAADRGTLTHAEVAALFEGLDLRHARRLRRWNPENSPGHPITTR